MKRDVHQRPLRGEEKLGFAYQEARGYPMEVYPAGRVDGAMDLAKFRQAVRDALETLPHLRRLLVVEEKGRRKRLFWSTAPDEALDALCEVEDLEIDEGADPDEAFQQVQWKLMNSPGLDLTRELGLKCYIFRAGPELHYVLFRFNHILADGRGILIFIALWRQRYIDLLAETAEPIAPFPEPDAGRVSVWKIIRSVGFLGFVRIVWGMLFSGRGRRGRPPMHLAHYDPDAVGEFRTSEVVMPADRLKAVKRRARTTGLTINEVSLAAAYHAILRWSRHFGVESGRITLNSPQDLRDVGSTEVANLVIPRTISLDPDRISNDEGLIETIRSQLRDWSERRAYLPVALGIALLGRCSYDFIVRLIRRTQRRGLNLSATVLLTNLGEVTHYGDLTSWGGLRLTRVFHGARGQWPPGYIVPVFSFNGVFTFAMGYFSPAMTEEKCLVLGRLFMEEIERLVGLENIDPPKP